MDSFTKTTAAPLTFSAEDFGKAIKLCKPALSHIALLPPRLEITEYNDYAALLARDIEIEITVPIGRAKPVAAMALPARAFKNLFSSAASSADIIISTNKSDFIKVEVDGMVAEFPEEDPEYPSPTHAGAHNPAINIDRKTLGHALNITTHAMSTEETRYYLNGVCLAPHPADPTAIIFCATDGHRLVKHIVEGLTHELTETIIVPRDMVHILRKMLANTTGRDAIDITIMNSTRIIFSCEDFHFTGKLIDGTFPDFDRVVPQNNPVAATIFAAPLKRFLSRIAAVAKDTGAPAVSLVLDAKQDILRVEWKSVELGTITARLEGHVERSFTVGFQYRFLINMLDALKTENITFLSQDAEAPAIFATSGELRDPSTTIVIMPTKV
jgi:DNA polymerase-3 subunit beta